MRIKKEILITFSNETIFIIYEFDVVLFYKDWNDFCLCKCDYHIEAAHRNYG